LGILIDFIVSKVYVQLKLILITAGIIQHPDNSLVEVFNAPTLSSILVTRTVLSSLDRLREMFHKLHNLKQFPVFYSRAIRVTTASPTTTDSDAATNVAHPKAVDALKAQLQATMREQPGVSFTRSSRGGEAHYFSKTLLVSGANFH
jgi:hypothetical protein